MQGYLRKASKLFNISWLRKLKHLNNCFQLSTSNNKGHLFPTSKISFITNLLIHLYRWKKTQRCQGGVKTWQKATRIGIRCSKPKPVGYINRLCNPLSLSLWDFRLKFSELLTWGSNYVLPWTSICLDFHLNNSNLFNMGSAPFGFVTTLYLFLSVRILFKSLRGPPSPYTEKRVKGELQEDKS